MNTVKRAVAVFTTGLLFAGSAFAQPATPSPPAAPPGGDVKQQQQQGTAPASPAQRTKGVTDDAAKGQAGKPDASSQEKSGKGQAGKPDTMKSEKGVSTRMAARADNPELVRQVQQALKDKGQDPGPVDGVMGSRTKDALKSYQQAEGLKATGEMDAQTLAKLGVSDGASPSAAPRPAPSSVDAEKEKRGGDTQTTAPGQRKQNP
jgi:Putative peptidoglycan binding domain